MLLAILCIAILSAVPLVVSWTAEQVPVIGLTVPSDYVPYPHGALASSTAAYNTMISPRGSFRVGFESLNVVRLVIPTDTGFSTPDGTSASSTFSEVQAVATSLPILDPNFGYTVLLPSGWTAHFKEVDGAIVGDSPVNMVFMR